jgi:hypothetical protein
MSQSVNVGPISAWNRPIRPCSDFVLTALSFLLWNHAFASAGRLMGKALVTSTQRAPSNNDLYVYTYIWIYM